MAFFDSEVGSCSSIITSVEVGSFVSEVPNSDVFVIRAYYRLSMGPKDQFE